MVVDNLLLVLVFLTDLSEHHTLPRVHFSSTIFPTIFTPETGYAL